MPPLKMEGKSFRRRHDFRTPRLFVPVLLNLIAVPVIVFTRSATMFSFPISLSLSLSDRRGRTPSSRDSPRESVSHVYLKARGDRRL